ncbi:hypothetical protein CVT26_015589 [Gymnopilus dilepis]|uniref:Heterokaryon incompatibility domain-containing protein n=1 Tax=Gymnopilus dilepis TaxID=231916 RepID=A0A409XYW0_9AGAR|nr:hypothetical protein CVT26_015589 [Gymnopilus dilepis]
MADRGVLTLGASVDLTSPSRKAGFDEVDESDEWDSESDNANSETDEGIWRPPLLAAPMPSGSADNNLCKNCQKVGLKPRMFMVLPEDKERANNAGGSQTTLATVRHLKNRQDCALCRLILGALGHDIQPTIDGKTVSVVITWDTYGPIPDIATPNHHIPKIRVLKPRALAPDGRRIYCTGSPKDPEITILANDSPSNYKTFLVRKVGKQINFRMVRNWLRMCEKWHGSRCSSSKLSIPAMPYFRLVDVLNSCVALVSDQCIRYVALSYVWGKIDSQRMPLRLLRSNVSQLAKPGALLLPKINTAVPRTILDAMKVVSMLGFRYLWVDMLCIVQDGRDEEKMSAIQHIEDIFSAAHLTIIAAAGSDCNAGLPGVRPGSRGTVQRIERISPNLRLSLRTQYQDSINDSLPYYRRAWQFQEEKFSKRSLIFIGGQAVFKCMENDQWREDVFVEHRDAKYGTPHRQSNPDVIEQCEEFIKVYSPLKLTFEADVYPAFSSAAKFMKLHLKANLCHGIPDAFFDWFILWTPNSPQRRREKLPSWSWVGWECTAVTNISYWYSHNIKLIRKALRRRTWIIWYERDQHDEEGCRRVWIPHTRPTSSKPRNFYGSHVVSRFQVDCSLTEPTPRTVIDGPTYYASNGEGEHKTAGSGFLQFWTLSVTFTLAKEKDVDRNERVSYGVQVGLFGRDGSQLGTLSLNPEWEAANVPGVHEFILLCEGRDEPAKDGSVDDDEGWTYKIMLIEWHGDWAERVSLGSLQKEDLKQALGDGPVWKEIILG